MTSATMSTTPVSTHAQTASPEEAIARVMSVLSGGTYQGPAGAAYDGTGITAALLTSVRDGLLLNSRLQQSAPKAPIIVQIQDPQQLADKNFWDSVFSAAHDIIPVVVQALSKDFTPVKSVNDLQIPANRRNDKDWLSFVGSILQTTVPQVFDLLQGKAYNPTTVRPPQVPPGKDKDWANDAVRIGLQALPLVLSFF
jgi:hypothetical protein